MDKTPNFMPYEFMVKYTPQDAWIKGKGILLWLAFFFSEAGAGIYLVSLFLNFRTGWILGWLLTLVVGGGLHVLYLGKPMRVIYMFLKPTKSELSRGLWVILFFSILGFIQVAPVVVSALPWTGTGQVLKTIMGIICILIITHGFLTMSIVKALPVWNSSMMVPLAVISGIWVGSQVAVLMTDLLGQNLNLAEIWARWSLLGFIAFLGIFLLGAAHSSTSAQVSIKRLLAGEWSIPFYIGVVAIGIVIPLIITIAAWESDLNSIHSGVLLLRCLCVVIGDLMMRYGIMKNALYPPLI